MSQELTPMPTLEQDMAANAAIMQRAQLVSYTKLDKVHKDHTQYVLTMEEARRIEAVNPPEAYHFPEADTTEADEQQHNAELLRNSLLDSHARVTPEQRAFTNWLSHPDRLFNQPLGNVRPKLSEADEHSRQANTLLYSLPEFAPKRPEPATVAQKDPISQPTEAQKAEAARLVLTAGIVLRLAGTAIKGAPAKSESEKVSV